QSRNNGREQQPWKSGASSAASRPIQKADFSPRAFALFFPRVSVPPWRVFLRPRSTSPPDDATQSPTLTAPAPTKIRWSTARRHSLPDAATRTISSDLPDSDTRGTQTNIATRDISDETDRGYAGNRPPRSPVLRAYSCDAVQPKPRQSPHSAHARKDISCIPRPQTSAASHAKPALQSSPATFRLHPTCPTI